MSWMPSTSIPDNTTIGIAAKPGSPRCSRRNVQPSITGMRRSSRMTSAVPPPRRYFSASCPLKAGTGANPSRLRNLLINRTRFGSSSTTSTLDGIGTGPVYARLTPLGTARSVRFMQRRDFLKIVGAASVAPPAIDGAAPASPAATGLYEDRSVVLEHVGLDPARDPQALWIRKRDLPRVNGFTLKPQG